MSSNFTVIKGGKPDGFDKREFDEEKYVYVSGTATNTRLMGTVALCLRWECARGGELYVLDQLFGLEASEYGIETYNESYGNVPDPVRSKMDRMVRALGGCEVPVSEKEARFLVQSYVHISEEHGYDSLEDYDLYSFLMYPVQELTSDEYYDLFERLSGELPKRNYTINYFLMRVFEGDSRGAAFLLADAVAKHRETIAPDDFPDISAYDIRPSSGCFTLQRNTIEKGEPKTLRLCESLIQKDEKYRIVTSEIRISSQPYHGRYLVESVNENSSFSVTHTEVAMMTAATEYVVSYVVDFKKRGFQEALESFARQFTETPYAAGILYTDFFPTNSHVGKSVYVLSNDVRALLFLTDSGQLIIGSKNIDSMFMTQVRIGLSDLKEYVHIVEKYEFATPTLFDFALSGLNSFENFVKLVYNLSPRPKK